MLSLLGLHCPHVEGCAMTADLAPGRGALLLPTIRRSDSWTPGRPSPCQSCQPHVLLTSKSPGQRRLCLPVATTRWLYFYDLY